MSLLSLYHATTLYHVCRRLSTLFSYFTIFYIRDIIFVSAPFPEPKKTGRRDKERKAEGRGYRLKKKRKKSIKPPTFFNPSHYIDKSARETVKVKKQKADVIITEYLQKIYGFAYKKSFSYDETEELAAEMTAEIGRASCRERV